MKKRFFKKAFTCLLASAMVVTTVGTTAFAGELTVGSSDRKAALLMSDGAPQQDEDGYYLLGTAEDLRWFADQVNAGNVSYSAKLTADIDLGNAEFTPIAYDWYGDPYSGTLDGNGHRISGLSITEDTTSSGDEIWLKALIGITKNATVKNLTVEGTVSDEDGIAWYLAGIVAEAAANTIVENCVSEVNITSKKGYDTAAGGIVGSVNGEHSVINGCINKGTVSLEDPVSTSYAGGIVGYRTQNGCTISWTWR